MVSQWNASGIFPKNQYVTAQWRSQKSTIQIKRNTRKYHRKNPFHVDVQRHSCGTKDNETECLANAKLVSLYARRFWKCGEVADVVGALTPVVGGVTQVFHDLLVELRLLLVAEVEEGEKGRQTGGRWRGRRRKSSRRDTNHMDGHADGMKCGEGSNLSQCECDEMCQEQDLRAHAQLCSATQAVKCAVALSSPSSLASVSLSFLSQFYFSTLSSWFSLLWYCNSSSLVSRSHFSHMFSPYFHGIFGVVFTHPRRLQ